MSRCWTVGLVLGVVLTRPAQPGGDAPAKDKILKRFTEEFVLLTPGKGQYPASFTMGAKDGPDSEKPARTVTFAYEFAMCKYEVTQELYAAIMGVNPSRWK